MNYKSKNSNKKLSTKDKIIKRQMSEIESLKESIAYLELNKTQKEELIHSVEKIRNDLLESVNELKEKQFEYEKLIQELTEMKKAMNQIVFNNKWKLIRWLIK